MRAKEEWLIILLGTRKEGGLHVIVDDYYVPPTQHRTSTHCKPYKEDLPSPSEDFPAWVISKMVGSLHSHHSMGARFSGGDLAKDGLCSTFSANIVIGSSVKVNNEEAYYLGFEYQAELHFDLPCGGIGVCDAKIIPKGVEDWPLSWEVIGPSVEQAEYKDLGDCNEYDESGDSDRYSYRRLGKCGVLETGFNLHYGIFGSNGKPILNKLPKPYEPPKKEISKTYDKDGYYYRDEADVIYIDKYLEYAREYGEYDR